MSIDGKATNITIDVDAYTKTTYMNSIVVNKVANSGNIMTGRLDMGGNNISNVSNPISNQDDATKSYADTLGAVKLAKAGDVMSGALSMGGNNITNVGNSTNAQDAVTKYYIKQLEIPKFVVTSGIIPATTNTGIMIYTLRSGKTVNNRKITIAGLYGLTVTVANLIINGHSFIFLLEDQRL